MGAPPAVVNCPAAATSPFGRTATAVTEPFVPVPRECHVAPSHRAMLLALTPKTVLNVPATIRSPLGSPATARAPRKPALPGGFQGADQSPVAGSHAASPPLWTSPARPAGATTTSDERETSR